MADKVKHWPSWANWRGGEVDGRVVFFEHKPFVFTYTDRSSFWKSEGTRITAQNSLELVEIDPDTPWTESKQRRPE